MPSHAPYAVAKAALHHLVSAAAHELGGRRVRVTGVVPGLVDRAGLEEAWPEGVARYRAAAALARPVTADEVAAGVAFLASGAASGITGTTLTIDAGWSSAPGW
jgi:NAD(P)-dependent dehydrogenase (short-subunit alcohol dehydrogenase family)